ncbi:protein BTG4 [Elgaria multicarinata webbii]|uniref:protein BTG4 n=1 Tax=Elgaria multicarinata webbii TaxID=159646 RepID=UPI002FCD31D1
MKDEIATMVFFITRLVKKHNKLSKAQLEMFASKLLTTLFERYKNHWYPDNPSKGQAFRCIRINQFNARDPLLDQACAESNVDFRSLGLPKELTVWVDPFEVSCRYGEKNLPFTVAHFEGNEEDHDISQCIRQAVDKALTYDHQSSTSSDEESSITQPKSIPTVSNPNSVYQCGEPFHIWAQYSRRKVHGPDGVHPNPASDCYLQYKGYKACRPSAAFAGPRIDRYHWVNSNR